MQAPLPVSASPPPFVRRWTPRRVILATLAVVTVCLGFVFIWRFSSILFVLFVAAVLATAMRPAVRWLEKRHVPQWAGVLLIYLTLALISAGVVATLVPLVIDQGSRILQDIPAHYTETREQLRSSSSQILRRIGRNLPAQISFGGTAGTAQPATTAEGDQQSIIRQTVGYIQAFGWGLFAFLAVFLIAFFWTRDRDQIVRAGLLIVPIDNRPTAQQLWDTAERKVGAYIRGQALLMLSIGVATGIAMFALGVPSALIIAILAALLEAVPYIGPILTAVIAVLITLAEAPDKIWLVIGAMVLIQQLENAVLVPRIMDREVGVNPLVTLLGIAAFGTLFGVLGAILAIPLAAIIQVLLDHWVLSNEAQPSTVIEGRDKAAVVRYQAQDLAQDIRDRIRARPSVHEGDEDTIEERIEAIVGDIDELLIQVSTPVAPQTISAPGGRIP
jgi:predicted PurR-regulated permease PerM